MQDVLAFSLMVFSAIFFVVDPLGALPIYMAMTSRDTPEKRRSIAFRSTFAAVLFLVGFALAGHIIFKLFGITLAAFKVAGGIILLQMSIDMISARETRVRTSPEELEEGIQKEDVAIIPLAIPMMAGPGSISTVMVLMGRSSGSIVRSAVVIGAVVVTGIISYYILRGGELAMKILGHTGLNVIGRVMGLILSAIAIQFIIDGLHDAYQLYFPLTIISGLGK